MKIGEGARVEAQEEIMPMALIDLITGRMLLLETIMDKEMDIGGTMGKQTVTNNMVDMDMVIIRTEREMGTIKSIDILLLLVVRRMVASSRNGVSMAVRERGILTR